MNIKNMAVVAYTNFSSDSRVQKEALAATDIGYNVDIYSLYEKNASKFHQFNFIKSGIFQYKGNSGIQYIISYLKFFLYCTTKITINYFSKKYAVIHCHNMPNFLVFSSIIPKIFGSKIILDIHDLMPELYAVKFRISSSHFLTRLLYFEERMSARFANEIIATNKFHIERFKENKFGNKRIIEIINVADERVFYEPKEKDYFSENLIIAYPSTLSKRLGIEVLIEAIEILKNKGIKVKLNIYGDGEYRTEIKHSIKNKNLENIINLSDSFVSLENLTQMLDDAHIGVIPLPRDPSNDIAMPVKIYEYFAKKICVVASDLKLLKSYFEDFIQFFEAGDSKDLANKIEYLNDNREILQEYAERGFKKFSSEKWSYYNSKLQKLLLNDLE